MSWHHIPEDDAWKQAHPAMLVRLGKRAWLHCDDCRHSIMIEPHELAQRHGLDMQTPLLTISKAMRSRAVGLGGDAAGRSRTIRERVKTVEGRPACGLTGPHQQTRTANTGPLFSQLTGSSGEIVTI